MHKALGRNPELELSDAALPLGLQDLGPNTVAQGVQVLPGGQALRPLQLGWQDQLRKTPSLPRGLLATGFLDPIQIPFNYPRQMAMPVIGGNRIRIPGDSGRRGGGAAPCLSEPVGKRGSFSFNNQPQTTRAHLPGTSERAGSSLGERR